MYPIYKAFDDASNVQKCTSSRSFLAYHFGTRLHYRNVQKCTSSQSFLVYHFGTRLHYRNVQKCQSHRKLLYTSFPYYILTQRVKRYENESEIQSAASRRGQGRHAGDSHAGDGDWTRQHHPLLRQRRQGIKSHRRRWHPGPRAGTPPEVARGVLQQFRHSRARDLRWLDCRRRVPRARPPGDHPGYRDCRRSHRGH